MKRCKICDKELRNQKRIYCSNRCKFSDEAYNQSRINKQKNPKNTLLKCKACEWKSSDVTNKSGVVTRHLIQKHNLKFHREQYLEYFDIIELPPPETLKCPLCGYETPDLNNTSGVFTTHLTTVHNQDILEFLGRYPKYNFLWQTLQKKQKLEGFKALDDKNRILCQVCKKYFKKLSNTHLSHHGLTPTQYKIKFDVFNTTSDFTSNLQSDITTRYNLESGSIGSTQPSKLERDFSKKLKDLNITFVSPFLFEGKRFDFYIPEINAIVEIDGEAFHRDSLSNLTIQTVNGSVNDFAKTNLIKSTSFNLFRIRYMPERFVFASSAELEFLLKSAVYHPEYSLRYKQKICSKEYFQKFIEVKGKQKLAEYVPLFLRFLRVFHPEFPFPPNEESPNDVVSTIATSHLSDIFNPTTKEFSNNISNVGSSWLKNHFQSYWKSSFKGNKSPIDAWHDDTILKQVISYRIGLNSSGEIFDFSLHQMIRGLSARRLTISFFKPLLAAAIYEHYLKGVLNPVVFDPCCGFGGRLVGFKSKFPNGKYIGCEPNLETYEELCSLIKTMNWSNVEIHHCPVENFDIPLQPDLIFTSIPYYDLEKYSQTVAYSSFDSWKTSFIKKICSLSRTAPTFLNMSSDLANQLGFQNVDASIVSNRSHFDSTDGLKSEPIIKL
jgi:hypothetical protein